MKYVKGSIFGNSSRGQEIYVDLQALSRVHEELRSIHNDFNDFDSGYALANAGSMGHSQVAAAFTSFVYGWTDGREQVNEQCHVACEQIRGAVDAYLNVEQHIGGQADSMKGGA